MIKDKQMKSKVTAALETILPGFLLLIAVFCIAATLSRAGKQSVQRASTRSQPAPKAFATPKQASEALIQATATFDLPVLKEILGPDGEDLLYSEDPVRYKKIAAEIATQAR